jgi:hypothetical protein
MPGILSWKQKVDLLTGLLILIMALFCVVGTGQVDEIGSDPDLAITESDSTTVKPKSDVGVIWTALKYNVSSPWRWDKSDRKTALIYTGLVVGAVLVEEDVRSMFQRNHSGFGDTVEEIGYWYGSPGFTGPFSLLTWGAGALFDSPKIRETGMMLVESMAMVAMIQQPLRMIVGRARPHMEQGNLSFNPFTVEDGYGSFISGHAWSAFTVSTVLALQIDNPWASVGLYSLALTTPVARMYTDKHWFSDVLAGSVLGYFSARSLWNWRKEGPGAAYPITLIPLPNGVAVAGRF